LSSTLHAWLCIPYPNAVSGYFFSAILNFVLEGDAVKAKELTEELAPNLLENDMDLHFDLTSLHFIELVRSDKR
jgi:hypothetical protein